MSERDRFYAERDSRSSEYVGGRTFENASAHIAVGRSVVGTEGGQVAFLSLVNQLVRVVPRLSCALPDGVHPVVAWTPFGGGELRDATRLSAQRIDPFATVDFTEPSQLHAVSLGIGPDVPAPMTWYIGADGAIGLLNRKPVRFAAEQPTTVYGAAVASCLGAGAAIRNLLGFPVAPRVLSAWNFAEGESASAGPLARQLVDVGQVLLVGAGAVANALVHWLKAFGVSGSWDILDRDETKLHNTNRGLLLTAEDAGWGGSEPAKKADVLARYLPSARPFVHWYHECPDIANEHYDVVLCLANEFDVRTRLAARSPTVTLHATTGRSWLSQLHRHITGRDDCIRCRTRDVREPDLPCSTGVSNLGSPGGNDAALPFLSAASGLMLAMALHRLMVGDLGVGAENDWRWDFASVHRMAAAGRRRCEVACSSVLAPAIRRAVNRGRWAHLDPAGADCLCSHGTSPG